MAPLGAFFVLFQRALAKPKNLPSFAMPLLAAPKAQAILIEKPQS